MKEFKIYLGMTEDHMTEVLHSSLKDDSVPETFTLRHVNNAGVIFPSRFVKIIPISAHSHSFHISIWFVSLAGINEDRLVKEIARNYDEYLEREALRHILKHLRTRRFLSPFKSLMACTGVQVEHPLVTRLYEALVSDGNWSEAENVIQLAATAGLFDAYMRSSQPRAIWKRLYGVDADGDVPSRRGGHAMCIDGANGFIYLFGGWDGERSLDDFWVYAIAEDRWRLVTYDSSDGTNKPGPRSCHKMVFDPATGSIYLLGGLSDSDGHPEETSGGTMPPAPIPRQADFYCYHTRGSDAGKWQQLSADTTQSGGPPPVFDHQMVMDFDRRVMYVGGGRVNDGASDSIKYSGLYSYDVATAEWRLLQPRGNPSAAQPPLSRRFGHSMVFEPSDRMLFIFGGMEDGDRYLSDMYAYHIDSNTATEVFSNFTASGGPDKTFTQRAVIDPTLREIYVFCGLTRTRPNPLPRLDGANWVYRYDAHPGAWTKMLSGESNNDDVREQEIQQPRTRYAHQVVYDPRTRTVYLHGGNAGRLLESGGLDEKLKGDEAMIEQRLDDFWSMTLERPGPEETIRRAKFQIRCQQFREVCKEVPAVQALKFLQTEVSAVVDHTSSETDILRNLLSHLLAKQTPADGSQSPPHVLAKGGSSQQHKDDVSSGVSGERNKVISQETFHERTSVFQGLLAFFPADAREPSSNLVDMIDWYEESVHA
ncbi:hypothetical protein BV25DRAFT_1990545 [Artomyces pyxidatus]|uniref:Uncharacterized protein n=1 Tax=Artomyces pyxidatus TaxID=48021 RepID=A0ACB8T5Z7_9AGAM|nr:hypothetical protein BV25DRAFT_1990545 [Artomyces pyxidatus]